MDTAIMANDLPFEQLPTRLRVYLVEDSPAVRERLEDLINSISGACSIGHAAGANEAIGEILAQHPDAVVLDIGLAEGSGFDVLRAVHDAAPDIAVYVLSNYATEPYRRLAHRLGAVDFFDKTTEMDRVREALAARAS
jgi:DNA-binding NarL/FixJ family response regulator